MGATNERDPYVILGVQRHASAAEIRAAYRALVAKYHPDRHQGNPLEQLASEKMAEINRAYETLSDPARRRAYDAGAPAGTGGGGGAGGGGATWAAGGTSDFGAASGSSRRVMKVVAVLSLLPVLLRFGGLIVRGLVAVAGELMEALAVLRGTPFVAAAVLLVVVILLVALLRRRRMNKRATPP